LYRLRRDQFTSAPEADHTRLHAIAAARACRGSVVSHRSAALLHGLPLLTYRSSRPDLTVAPSGTGDVRGALLHRASLRSIDIIQMDEVPTTSVARTIADLARSSSTALAVVAADAAVHRGLTDLDAVEDVLLHCWNWPGIRRAWRSVGRVDGRSESPLESVSRLVLSWMRVPTPDLQARLCNERGWFAGRVDFYWPEFGVVGEADGRMKYEDRSILIAEKRRQEALEALGLIVVRWDWTDVTRRPRLLADRLNGAFERGRLRDRSGFPRQWSVQAA
jgi:hypothetical protein